MTVPGSYHVVGADGTPCGLSSSRLRGKHLAHAPDCTDCVGPKSQGRLKRCLITSKKIRELLRDCYQQDKLHEALALCGTEDVSCASQVQAVIQALLDLGVHNAISGIKEGKRLSRPRPTVTHRMQPRQCATFRD